MTRKSAALCFLLAACGQDPAAKTPPANPPVASGNLYSCSFQYQICSTTCSAVYPWVSFTQCWTPAGMAAGVANEISVCQASGHGIVCSGGCGSPGAACNP